MVRHLFKNFWLSFTKNTLQLLGLFLMLIIIITLFGGMMMSNTLSKNQINIIGKNLFTTNIDFSLDNNALKIVSNSTNMSYGLTNINYINDHNTINSQKAANSYFALAKIGSNNYQVILDDKNNNQNRWLTSNSSNAYFQEQLATNNKVIINFQGNILPNSNFFLNDNEYNELISYLQNPNGLIPFVSSADNPNLATLPIFTTAYYNFSQNQSRIYDLGIRLLNTIIIGSVADKAMMKQTMDVYDIFQAEYFYIQSDCDYFWTKPVMIKGSYDFFLNYNAQNDYPPIIMNSSYAKHKKIPIGNLFDIYGFTYRVVGFATNAYVNSASSTSSFTYNPYLWIRGDEYDQLEKNIADVSRIISTNINISGQLSASELNDGLLWNKNSWSDMANVYSNASFDYSAKGYTPLREMNSLIQNKENIIWSILIAISLLLIISSFIMISMIVNKLLLVNRGIIGNLKAQGYRTSTISFLLVLCFAFLMVIVSTLALASSWIFSFILNITYHGFLEFTTYLSTPTWWLILEIFLIPGVFVCLYAYIFIIVEVSKPTLTLLQPKIVKLHLPKGRFLRLNFKYKISLKFALDAKWKLLLTVVVTALTSAMLFTALTTIINFSEININLKSKANWKYLYQYDTNYSYTSTNSPPYDYLVYDSVEDVKNPKITGVNILDSQQKVLTKEMVLQKYNSSSGQSVCGPFIDGGATLTSLKYLWFKAKSYDWYVNNCQNTQYYNQIVSFISGSIYEYFINQLGQDDGIITLGYQPIIYGFEQAEIFVNSQSLWPTEALNYRDLQNFLQTYQNANNQSTIDLSISNFYRDFSNNFNLKSFGGTSLEFYDYQNKTKLFQPNVEKNTDINWFFNGIKSFDKTTDDSSLLGAALTNKFNPYVNYAILEIKKMKDLIQSNNWFYSKDPNWNPKNYRVQLYPIIVNKAFQFLNGVNIGDIFASNFNDRAVTFYVVVDEFNNGMKNIMLINRYNNTNITAKRLSQLYSSLPKNETYNYIGVFEKNNEYAPIPDPTQYEPLPIYNGTQNLEILLQQTVNLQIVLFLIYLLILIASVVACIFQIFIITNIIFKDNLKVLNSFKALGYLDFWIFNRMFLIYLPIIIISWLVSIPIGMEVINLIRYQIVFNMLSYVLGTVNLGDYLISFLGLFAMFIAAFILNKKFMSYRYPILKTMNWV